MIARIWNAIKAAFTPHWNEEAARGIAMGGLGGVAAEEPIEGIGIGTAVSINKENA